MRRAARAPRHDRTPHPIEAGSAKEKSIDLISERHVTTTAAALLSPRHAVAQLTAYCLYSVPCLTRTRDAHAHGRPRPSVRDRALQASKRTSPPSMSTTASQAKSMTAQVCQAWRRESRSSGTSGRERGVLRDATVAIPSPAAGRLRLPHPATARNLPSAADLRLAELCMRTSAAVSPASEPAATRPAESAAGGVSERARGGLSGFVGTSAHGGP